MKVFELINQCQNKTATIEQIADFCVEQEICPNIGMDSIKNYPAELSGLSKLQCSRRISDNCYDMDKVRACVMDFLQLEVEVKP